MEIGAHNKTENLHMTQQFWCVLYVVFVSKKTSLKLNKAKLVNTTSLYLSAQ